MKYLNICYSRTVKSNKVTVTSTRVAEINEKIYNELASGNSQFLKNLNINPDNLAIIANIDHLTEADLSHITMKNLDRWHYYNDPTNLKNTTKVVQSWYTKLELLDYYLKKLNYPQFIIIYYNIIEK